jgi:hypothetical protein
MTNVLHLRFRNLLTGLMTLGLLAGCAGQEVVNTIARPGKYRLYNCDQLDRRGAEVLKRERELAGLMEKAKQGAGGELAVAIAYQNEYNIALGDLREIELMAAERNCELKFRTAGAAQ